MKNGKSLIETNKYLQDEKFRETLIMEHAITSARIEGVPNPVRIAEELERQRKTQL